MEWTASDYIETTTAERNIYIAPNFRQKDVREVSYGRYARRYLLPGAASTRAATTFIVRRAKDQTPVQVYWGSATCPRLFSGETMRSFNKPITPEYKHRLHLATEASKKRRRFEWGDLS
ncbi:hypothetical protein H2204_001247 [Knufia peltigerae]|uniref:Uncharacterized protein n=1 Tax=Knufia peltigerae TaxID=1002370 RepID=A0AA38YCY4_9EURO|nr:hypothetical protein H2204_001247 [Knufia peltigerae]